MQRLTYARKPTEAELYRRVVLADVEDETQDFTIPLWTYPVAHIVSVSAPDKAKAGSTITVTVTLQNVGSADGYLWSYLTDIDTGYTPAGGEKKSAWVAVNGTYDFTHTLTMPNKNWNLRAHAGHTE